MSLLVVFVMVFGLAACGSAGKKTNGEKILMVYFSHTGEDESIGYIEKGNIYIVADMIAEQTGDDTFEIRTINHILMIVANAMKFLGYSNLRTTI